MATTFAEDLATLMSAWNKAMAAAKQQFPGATEEELYQMVKRAADKATA